MIIKPKIRGFICTTTHPTGCKVNVEKQIEYVKQNGKIEIVNLRLAAIGKLSPLEISAVRRSFAQDLRSRSSATMMVSALKP